jgi:histone-lysine N-methyltransferase SETMAR
MYHDNARPHSANQTTATLRSFKWEVLQHLPYSPDLAPSDFHLFDPLKHHLSGERVPDDDAVERAVRARGSNSNQNNFTPQVSRKL